MSRLNPPEVTAKLKFDILCNKLFLFLEYGKKILLRTVHSKGQSNTIQALRCHMLKQILCSHPESILVGLKQTQGILQLPVCDMGSAMA